MSTEWGEERTGLGASCPSHEAEQAEETTQGPCLLPTWQRPVNLLSPCARVRKLDPIPRAASSQGDEQTSLYCGAQALGRQQEQKRNWNLLTRRFKDFILMITEALIPGLVTEDVSENRFK